MKLRIIIYILLLFLSSYGVSGAEQVDITQDLQKKIAQQPGRSGVNNFSAPPANGAPADKMNDIFDIKPIEDFGYDKRIIWVVFICFASLLFVILLIYLLDRYLKTRKKINIPSVPDLPPDLEAYKLLAALEKESGVSSREFYFRLTSIVKGYTGRRFNIDAPEMTIEELLPKINELDFDKALKTDLKEMLAGSEPVKFAGSAVLTEKMETDLLFVKNYIKNTPVEIQEPEGSED